ncbi:MAG: hypothetical protein JHC31_07565, partial [Sulfurihydrogenibium sp.]|nr:hypothetical protein [Sulfurihydrogenibium sp.]
MDFSAFLNILFLTFYVVRNINLSPLAKIQNFSILMTDSFIIEVIDMVKVIVKSIAIDSLTGSPIVLLADEENQ